MKVELFLRTLEQEFPANAAPACEERGERLRANAGWSARANWGNWGNWNNWTNWTNWTNFSSLSGASTDTGVLGLRLRDESFGGLAFDPSSRCVFRLDPEGLQALRLLKEGKTSEEVCSALSVKPPALRSFLAFFERFRRT